MSNSLPNSLPNPDSLLLNEELYSLYQADNADYNFAKPADPIDPILNRYFHPAIQQRFVHNFMNVNTPVRSLHLFHSTGSGKTAGSLYISNSYIKAYKMIYKNNKLGKNVYRRNTLDLSPTVFILGFAASQKVFKKELMRFSEFGIVSQEELIELQQKEAQSKSGVQSDIRAFKEYKDRIKRRITNKEKGGFYQFLGYEELVNRLFYSDKLKLNDLEKEAEQDNIDLEQVYKKYLEDGSIQINEEFLALFTDSLVICDEIHVAYNGAKKNDRGIALQYIIDKSRLYLLTLSATPIKGAVKECIDWINFHMAANKQPLLKKEDFFENDKKMFRSKLEEFGTLTRGLVSFFQDINYEDYPERIFMGEPITLTADTEWMPRGTALPYLKFTECPMSPLHQRTYDEYMKEVETNKINTGSRALLDIVFPNPSSADIGIFKSSEVAPKILSADLDWRLQNGIDIKKTIHNISVASGTWLQMPSLTKYSAKYAMLIQDLTENIQRHSDPLKCQKTMIYHHKVRGSGVLLIEEILLQNGFVDEFSNPTDHTICWVCGVRLVDHKDKTDAKHEYFPARFVIAHSNVDKKTLDISLDKFNHPSNKNGLYYGILLGSKMISETFDFKDIQQLRLLSVPVNISSLIQTFGRAIRNKASIALPPEQRKTYIWNYVSSCSSSTTVSYEIASYADKLSTYTYIQEIEREVIKNAIDIKIHWNTIMREISPTTKALGALWFPKPEMSQGTVSKSAFNNYEYGDDEVLSIMYLIKRAFLIEPVWTYARLLDFVHKPHIPMSVNTERMTESNFIIALSFLLNANIIHNKATKLDKFVESIYNPEIRIIHRNGHEHKIKQIGDNFILFPVSIFSGESHNSFVNYTYNISDDVETYLRQISGGRYQHVDVSEYLRKQEYSEEYQVLKQKLLLLIASKQTEEYITELLYDYNERFQIKVLEEAIENNSSPDFSQKSGLQKVIDLFNALGAVIMSDEIILYQDVLKYYEGRTLKKGVPMGYAVRNKVRLFNDASEERWFDISKVSLNRHIKYRDNNVIIGFLQDELDVIKFKLMPPQSKKNKDKRKDIRGMVCAFRDKYEIMEIAASLGISLKKYKDMDLKINIICGVIRDFLIDKEMKDRQRGSQFKWLYGWW